MSELKIWQNQANIDLLIAMHVAGETRVAMAKVFRISDDAIAGKLHRLSKRGLVATQKARPGVGTRRVKREAISLDTIVPHPPTRSAVSPDKPAEGVRAAPLHRKCQFPLWPDRARPTFKFCDAPCEGSWCAAHMKVVWVKAPAMKSIYA